MFFVCFHILSGFNNEQQGLTWQISSSRSFALLIIVCKVFAQCEFLTCNLLFTVENLPVARVRESHMATSFLYKVKKMIPFPIFAVLFVSSIGAYKMASNKKGGMLTYKNIINLY